MKKTIASIGCAVGLLFGGLGAGVIGMVTGGIAGFAVGFAYAALLLAYRGPKALRFVVGTVGGTVAGGLAGVAVHVPGYFGFGEQFWGGGTASMQFGGVFGLCVGAMLGMVIVSDMLIHESKKK